MLRLKWGLYSFTLQQTIKPNYMKKILLLIGLLMTINCLSQSLDTVTVNLTLRSGDWAFIAGSVQVDDSLEVLTLRRLRDTVRTANPANFTTNVRFNSIPGRIVFRMYVYVKQLPITLYEQVGTNINTQIKAIPNTTLQNFITAFDNQANQEYINRRTKGKFILFDN